MLLLVGSWERLSALIIGEKRERGKRGRGGERKGGQREGEMALLALGLAPAMIT